MVSKKHFSSGMSGYGVPPQVVEGSKDCECGPTSFKIRLLHDLLERSQELVRASRELAAFHFLAGVPDKGLNQSPSGTVLRTRVMSRDQHCDTGAVATGE